MPVQIPENAAWWQQLLAWTLISVASASMPIVIAWLNRIHKNLTDNTSKTEKIEHAVNGALSDRLKKVADVITERIQSNLSGIDNRLREIETRVMRIEEREVLRDEEAEYADKSRRKKR